MTVGCSELLGLFPTFLMYALSEERIGAVWLCAVCGKIRATYIDRRWRLRHGKPRFLRRWTLLRTWFAFCGHVELLLDDARKIQYYTDQAA